MLKKLSLLVIILITSVWMIWFRPLFLGGKASYIIVSGSSMEPTLKTQDLAVMQRQANYKQGDIIAFKVSTGNVIHRIVGGTAQDGFITRGDNKNTVDPWRPVPEHILGRMWFHIPGGGKPLQNLRQPASIAALGGLAVLLFWDDSKKEGLKKRGKRMQARLKNRATQFTPPSWTLNALGAAAALALLCAALAGYGFLQPTERTETVERLRYEHRAAFRYTVHTAPSLLYPQESIGPVGPETTAAGEAAVPETGGEAESAAAEAGDNVGPPVFTRLARSLDLDFSYLLASQAPAEVQGQVGIDLQIRAGDGWVTTQALVPPAEFSGPSATAQASLDFQQILDFLNAVEEQTGFDPGTYELAIIPRVQVSGQIGEEAVEEAYAPAFTLELNETQIRLDPELARSEVKRVEAPELRPNQVRVLGLSLPVQALRLVGLAGAALGLLASVLLAVLYFKPGQDEAARLRARYGGLIVPVAVTDLGAGRKVQVASMPDLARLAQREGSMIFHQSFKGADLFFVPDGQVVYTYLVDKPAQES